ncbi:ABC transporter permease [Cellulomonas telluris]|uniref:ABC transporter permease n=1 Tax=Cellulomonas telluris TaxID=2306636 RepID=UPI0014562E00|nr:ABC transporter permease [Cellulomonas telluris]
MTPVRSEFVDGWRRVRDDRRRHLAAAVALTLGVALLFGTLVAARSIGAQLAAQAQSLGGLGDVGVVPELAGTTMDEGAATGLAVLDDVRLAVPTFSSRTSVRGAGQDEAERLVVTGYPVELGGQLPRLRVDGRLPGDGGAEVAVPDDVAQRLGVTTGDTVELAGARGVHTFTVVGVLAGGELGALAVDNVFVDLPRAQELFAEPGRLTRVDLLLSGGTDPGRWAVRHAEHLPEGTQVQDTAALATAAAPLLATLTAVLVGVSVATLVVASLLASSAFGTVLLARRPAFAVLRATGAPRGWLARSVVAEVLVVAVPCVVLGLALGLLTGRALEGFLASAGNLPAGPGGVPAWAVPLTAAVGVVAALLGAVRPARSAVAVDPVRTLRGEPGTSARRAPGRVRRVAGAALVLAALALAVLPVRPAGLALVGALGAVTAAHLLAPDALRLLAGRVAGSWATRLARGRALDGALGGVAATCAAVVALGVACTVAVGSVGAATVRQIGVQFGADVQVVLPVPVTDDELTRRVAAVPGAGTVAGTATADALVRAGTGEARVTVLAVEPEQYFQVADLPWSEGEPDRARAALAAGGAVVLPVALARELGARVGEPVTVEREGARVQLVTAGTYASLSTGLQVVVDRRAAAALGVEGTRQWFVRASPGSDVRALRDAVASEVADVPGAVVLTAADMRARAQRELATYSAAVLAVVVLMLVLGAVGSAGVLNVAVLARSRELAVLRATGAGARDLRSSVLREAVLVAGSAVVLAVPVGLLAGVLLTDAVGAMLRTSVTPRPTVWPLVVVVALTFVAMAAAAVGPARRAARVDPVVAMRAS